MSLPSSPTANRLIKPTLKTKFHIDPGALTGLRALFGMPVIIVYAAFRGTWHVPAPLQIAGIFLGALLGPFLGHMLYYRSLRYIDLSKASLLHSSQPLFVALFALIIFGTIPGPSQWLGGALVLAGVYTLVVGRLRPVSAPL